MIVVVMGVAGSGKTTIGQLLANRLGWRFFDADDYHPRSNIDKMRQGIPLDDNDRKPWIETLQSLLAGCIARGEDAVLACSALKGTYRALLRVDPTQVVFVYLKSDEATARKRLRERTGHFLHPDLLRSQFELLQEPEKAIVVDASSPPVAIVEEIITALNRTRGRR